MKERSQALAHEGTQVLMRPTSNSIMVSQFKAIDQTLTDFGFESILLFDETKRIGYSKRSDVSSLVSLKQSFAKQIEDLPIDKLLEFEMEYREIKRLGSSGDVVVVRLVYRSGEDDQEIEDKLCCNKEGEWCLYSPTLRLDPYEIVENVGQRDSSSSFDETQARRFYELVKAIHVNAEFKISAGSYGDNYASFGSRLYDQLFRFSTETSCRFIAPYEQLRAIRSSDLELDCNGSYGWSLETDGPADIIPRVGQWDESLNYKVNDF